MSIDQSPAVPASSSSENCAAYDEESARIKKRRESLGIPASVDQDGRWGLALSGGGIRSATFSLGVLQGMALAGRSPRARSVGEQAPASCLLEQFDYLSTVSGGGYIGGFFGSLFVPGRSRRPAQAGQSGDGSIDAALHAYEALRFDPPGRIRSRENYLKQEPGTGPLAWLRENGRYMLPSGAGDILYAVALGVRNWVALHYVLGSALLMLFSGIALLRILLVSYFVPEACSTGLIDWMLSWERCVFPTTQAPNTYLWASPLWLAAIAAIYLLVLPVGIAFWLIQPACGASTNTPPSRSSLAAFLALLSAGALLFAANKIGDLEMEEWGHVSRVLTALAFPVVFAGILSIVLSWYWHTHSTVSVVRVRMTRLLATTFEITAFCVVLAALDTLAQQLYWWLCRKSQDPAVASVTLPAVLAAFVWLVRAGSKLLDEKEKPAWLRFVPISALAALGGITMLVLAAMVWGVATQWLRWQGRAPTAEMLCSSDAVTVVAVLFLFAVGQAILLARFPGFLNLSSLQSIYGARLTRAYLGASNGERFGEKRDAGISEPLPSDALTVDTYYNNNVLAPVHLVNVTVNLTFDPAEQLVQRDRKGQPMVVGSATWFAVDGVFHRFNKKEGGGEIRQPLTVGQWIGVSGAAFTTGLGRSTSLGFSLLLGLANVRLGAWWESGVQPDKCSKWRTLGQALLRTQLCVQQELFGQFYGLRRKWQYLSDGGHFENTGVYELLRKERKNRFIVMCDNGCDPSYQFDDLANLIRLARIDLRLELAVDYAIADHDVLGDVFGTPAELADTGQCNNKCALLLNVFEAGAGAYAHDEPMCCIVVLKPRLIATAPMDVHQYQQAHRSFPQETTFDQSFDEAQWESYRRLGISAARRVFGRQGTNGVDMTAVLLNYLFDAHRKLRGVSTRPTERAGT